MNKQTVLDLYFAEARAKLIDLAAFLDRLERADGEGDFRLEALCAGLKLISAGDRGRNHAQSVLTLLSDPTTEPLLAATTKSASGAWPHFGREDRAPRTAEPSHALH